MIPTFFTLLGIALLFWGLIFVTFFQAEGRSFTDYLLNRQCSQGRKLEVWCRLEPSSSTGSYLEERFILTHTWGGLRKNLVRQLRRREASGAIVEVYQEEAC